MSNEFEIEYDGEVLTKYFNNKRKQYQLNGKTLTTSFEVSIIQGPVGSGKTRVSWYKLFMGAAAQIAINGKKKSRWAIIRNTTPELKNTVLKDFLELFPETQKAGDGGWGKLNMTPPITYTMKKGQIEAEFIFLALDDEGDIKKLKSMNLTGGYINEGQYVPLEIFTALCERVNRYPSKEKINGRLVGGASFPMVIMDMNAADETHWVPIMRGDVPIPDYFTPDMIRQYTKPPEWDFFMQPPALVEQLDAAGNVIGYIENPKAENTKYLPEGYYLSKVAGQSKATIDMTCLNKTGVLRGGKPVFLGWNPEIHIARENLQYKPELDLYVGLDFGRTPAAVWAQTFNGRWFVLGDYYLEDTGTDTFAPLLKKELAKRIPNIDWTRCKFWGDPAGDFRGQSDESTGFMLFKKHGVIVNPAKAALRVKPRHEAVDGLLARMVHGYAGLLVDKSATMLVGAFNGGYRWRTVRGANGTVTTEEIADTRYTHNMDAFFYCITGGGEIKTLMGQDVNRPPSKINTRVETRVYRSSRSGVWSRR